MKKHDWLIVISTAAYSFLFYDQSAGLNFFIFNIVLVSLLLVQNTSLLTKPAWVAAAVGALVSSFFVFNFGTWLPILANICSLLMLSGLSFSAESSLLISMINALFSVVVTIPQGVKKMFEPDADKPGSESIFSKLPFVVIPLGITTIFFFLYRAANPVFQKYTDNIDIDFISIDWLVFTGIGLILMASIFRHYVIKFLTQTDELSGDGQKPITQEEHMAGIPAFTITNELLTGVLLFGMLNLLLLSVNSIDAYHMWVINALPKGVTIADFLHDGTNTLILSICMAIAVILFVFRGYLNFFENNKWLKLLAYGWIVQNAILVITTAQRNWWIIESSGLTRRRIGVYVYLLLCLIGLTTTFVKVMQKKSNWFLFRKNAWAFYAVFIVACFVNWDDFIVRYNCTHFKAQHLKYIDRYYQSDLSHTSLASMFEFYKKEKAEPVPTQEIFTNEMVRNMYTQYQNLKLEVDSASWKSYCLSKSYNVKAIDEMLTKGEIGKP